MKPIFAILIIAFELYGAFIDLTPEGATAGQAGIATFSDEGYIAFGNPAGLSESGLSAVAFYSNFWEIGALSKEGLGGTIKTSLGGVGVGLQFFGESEIYSETIASLSFGRNLTQKLSAGARFDYAVLDLGDYGSRGVPIIDIGTSYKLTQKISLAAYAQNISRTKLDDDDIDAPISIGAMFLPADWIRVYLDVQNYDTGRWRLRTSEAISLYRSFLLLFGLSGVPNKLYAGLGFHRGQLMVDYTIVFHNDLGVCNHIAVGYNR